MSLYYSEKHYALDVKRQQEIEDLASGCKRVLDVGGGKNTFKHATDVIDIYPSASHIVNITYFDVCSGVWPFDDNYFDFVYCSQTLEDLCNPAFVLSEMSRVGKRGAIVCPSIIQEISPNVDAGNQAWSGHHHHRYFVTFIGNEVKLLPKYPIVEYLHMDEDEIYNILSSDKVYWNDCLVWVGSIPYSEYRHNFDFHLQDFVSYRRLIQFLIDETINRLSVGKK